MGDVADGGRFTACTSMLRLPCSLSHSYISHNNIGGSSGKIVCLYTNIFTFVKNNVCHFCREGSLDAETILIHTIDERG